MAPSSRLLHISHARQDEAWVRGELVPALGLEPDQYVMRADDRPGAQRFTDLEGAVIGCRYTLLVASSAASVDHWVQLAALLAQHAGVEDGKPRLLLVARDFEPGSDRARELLPLRQRCLTALDCSTSEGTVAALARLREQLALADTVDVAPTCPYPGLRTFGSGDPAFDRTDLFFGREHEATDIASRLRAHGRVLLVGPSGCGKSSLIRARVVPALAAGADPMETVVVRPGAHPWLALREAVAALDRGRPTLVCVDPLEEIFVDEPTLDPAERTRFLEALGRLLHTPGVALLLSMRTDFYGDLMRRPIWDELKAHRVELEPLRGDALRRAITRPAELAGVHVEADLVERLVREADLDRAAEALPLLQVTLEQLWARRSWRYLSLASYARLTHGGQRGLDAVLAAHADATIADLPAAARGVAHRILIDLVHLGEGRPDTRRRRATSELDRAGDRPGLVAATLAHLAAHRLIATGSGDGARHVDLAHDTLITGWPALARWVAERREALVRQRRLERWAAEWEAAERRQGLLDEGKTAEARQWLASDEAAVLGWSEALADLVASSEAEHDRRRRAEVAMIERLEAEQRRTLASIAAATKVASEIVFAIDKQLQPIAGAAALRDHLLARSRALLDELRAYGQLGEEGERAGLYTDVGRADVARDRGAVDDARGRYQGVLATARELAAQAPTNLDFRRALATATMRLADVEAGAGTLADARALVEQSIDVRRDLAGRNPDDPQTQADLTDALDLRGNLALSAGRLDEARGWFEQGLQIRAALVSAGPEARERLHDLAESYDRMGAVELAAGHLAEAQRWFERDLAISRALADSDPTNAGWQRDLAIVCGQLGELAATTRSSAEARSWFEQARAIEAALVEAAPTNAQWLGNLAVTCDLLGDLALNDQTLADARRWFGRALDLRNRLRDLAPGAPSADTQDHLATSYARLGDVDSIAGDLASARAHYQRAFELRASLANADPENAEHQQGLSLAHTQLGDVAQTAGRLGEAKRHLEAALAIDEALVASDPHNVDRQRSLAQSVEDLAELLAEQGRHDGARRLYERGLEVRRALTRSVPGNRQWQSERADVEDRLGDLAAEVGEPVRARTWRLQALEIREALVEAEPTNRIWSDDLGTSYLGLGELAVDAGELGEAATWLDKALALAHDLAAHDPDDLSLRRGVALVLERHGDLAIAAHDADAARERFAEALAIVEELSAISPDDAELVDDRFDFHVKLANLFAATGETALAAAHRSQAAALHAELCSAIDADDDPERDEREAALRQP